MRRLLVYSHDTYGLGNLRRMLAICDHLIDGIHDLSILLVTGFYDVAIQLYDLVLVLGSPQLFDLTHEYDFPAKLAEKTRFCGYMRRQNGRRKLHQIRHDLGLGQNEKLVVVTAGGGQDGFRLLSTYITGTKTVAPEQRPRSLIISGPGLHSRDREALLDQSAQDPSIQMLEFTDDLMSYLTAAGVIVSMGGYNTVCEILSAGRRAIVVPRTRPVEEQHIRAERMAKLGIFQCVHPDDLTPALLMEAVHQELRAGPHATSTHTIDLDGLQRMTHFVKRLLGIRSTEEPARTERSPAVSAIVTNSTN